MNPSAHFYALSLSSGKILFRLLLWDARHANRPYFRILDRLPSDSWRVLGREITHTSSSSYSRVLQSVFPGVAGFSVSISLFTRLSSVSFSGPECRPLVSTHQTTTKSTAEHTDDYQRIQRLKGLRFISTAAACVMRLRGT